MSLRDKQGIVSGFSWRLAEQIGSRGIAFIISIILARILGPDSYGVVAIVTIFTTILLVFVDGGLGNALIQKKDADSDDFSTVFCFNIVFCAILYLMVFFAAPLISGFFEEDITSVLRVMSLTLIIAGFKNIQQAYLFKKMQYKVFFVGTIIGTVVSGIVGIFMAFSGFGVWALVWQNLINQFLDTLFLYILGRWRPKIKFKFDRFKSLFSYGSKILLANLISTAYDEARQIIIGKKYSSNDLALYNQGNKIPKLVVETVNKSIDSVLLPVMSESQENNDRVKSIVEDSLRHGSFISIPALVGLFSCSSSFVLAVLTERWIDSIAFLQIFCIAYLVNSFHIPIFNAIKAKGRSDIIVITEILKRIIGLTILLITMFFGPIAIAYGFLIENVVSLIITIIPCKRVFGFVFFDFIKAVWKHLVGAIIMGFIVWLEGFIPANPWVVLLTQATTGVFVYYLAAVLLKMESFEYFKKTVRRVLRGKHT